MNLRPILCALALSALSFAHAADTSVPPPSASAKGSVSELEKLVAPIALYPDALIATILPASVYPLEIVQAARFVMDTNNLAKLDDQPWDENVKAVARVPAAIQKLNDNLSWTVSLGQAFLEQPKEVMDMIQALRSKAQALGTLKTTPEQIVVTTNVVVMQTNVTQVVMVTNTVVQVQSSNPQIVYVPAYDPWYVYYPPPYYYAGPPHVVTFAVGVTVGLIIANNCDWHHGGIYVGHHGVAIWGGGGHRDVDIDIDRSVNIGGDVNIGSGNINTGARPKTSQSQKWQPDASRLNKAGAPRPVSTKARGWSSGTSPAARPIPPSPRATTPTFNRPNAVPGAPRAVTSSSSLPPGPSSMPRESAFSGVSHGAGAHSHSTRGSYSRGGGGGGGGFGGRR
jgi:hypothetical protein